MTPPRVLPPHYFVLSLVLIIGIGILEEGSLLPSPWQYLGLLPVLVGVVMAVQGSRLFDRAGTNIIPFTESSALVTSGVFSISRNPMYTGMVLALAGTALIMNGLLAWLVVIAFTALIRGFFIRTEERLMEKTFGEEYLAYKASVRRWI
ncbi:MAG: isoprenylcysteine carboxylmethyltransferase family protein [Gammaproteobacteria bacterium]|jgi:protein-S-isoprenylcysteine O-methyltransferase Ste14|nr:MAG: isoprenylcysteine carboxylmethyltransferase family protein [Gammaproteobacteria bacterium]